MPGFFLICQEVAGRTACTDLRNWTWSSLKNSRNREQLNHAELGLSIPRADQVLHPVKVKIKQPYTYNIE